MALDMLPPTRVSGRALCVVAQDGERPQRPTARRILRYTADATSTTRRRPAGPLFHSSRIPGGSYAEYFHDIDYIPEDSEWEAREWDPKYALYCWGPDVPRDFIENKEDPTA